MTTRVAAARLVVAGCLLLLVLWLSCLLTLRRRRGHSAPPPPPAFTPHALAPAVLPVLYVLGGVSGLIVIRIKAEAGPPAFDRSLKAERAECDGSIDTSTPNTQAAKSGTAAALHAASSSRQRRRVLGIICVKREPKRRRQQQPLLALSFFRRHHKKCKTRVLMIVINWRRAQTHIDVGSQDLNDLPDLWFQSGPIDRDGPSINRKAERGSSPLAHAM